MTRRRTPAASRLTALCAGYLVMMAAAGAVGGALAAWQGHLLSVADDGHVAQGSAGFFASVIGANVRVWLYTCAGLASFGVAGFFALLGNAFRFGMDATSMARGAPWELAYLVPHAVLEFAAFILAGASCQYLAWCLFDLLVLNRPRVPIRAGVQALAFSFILLVTAAGVETYARALRFG